MPESVKLIDPSIKDMLRRYPTAELVRKLFPDVRMTGRTTMCNPLRGERHASLSCFCRDGYWYWKDWATDETGDNIDFYRKAYPQLSYVNAVDGLSQLILGRGVFTDPRQAPVQQAYYPLTKAAPVQEQSPVLRIDEVRAFRPGAVPPQLLAYVRGRGISDDVSSRYFSYVRYVNTNREGRSKMDSHSGLPVVGRDGGIVREDGVNEAVAMANDIGGFSLRVPGDPGSGGFKGANASFFSTVTAYGAAPWRCVDLKGVGSGLVERVFYDYRSCGLYINPKQCFTGVAPGQLHAAAAFLEGMKGTRLVGRELKCATAVLNALSSVSSDRVTVVEGMFDGASVIELERMSSGKACPPGDLVILNSISHIRWAVPYLAVHREVVSLLDNDLRSSAGQKAFVSLSGEVEAFRERLKRECSVTSGSSLFDGYKDINDYLVSKKGFDAVREKAVEVREERRPKAARQRKANNNNKDNNIKPN